MKSEFALHDRVDLNIRQNSALAKGMLGTVVKKKSYEGGSVGVQFDNWNRGHDIDGFLETNSGWWVDQRDLDLIPTSPSEEFWRDVRLANG